MPSIVDNITRVLDALGIQGVQFVDIYPDRVSAIDRLGQLRKHVEDHPDHWMRDPMIAGHLIDPFHGGNVSGSYRERTRPSLQFVTHPVSQVNNPGFPCYDEIDIDYSPPDGPLDFLRHSAEVGHNLITRKKTDEVEVARLLDERFKEQNERMNFLDLMKLALSLKQMPASNSPAFSWNMIDWAKLLREFWALLLTWLGAIVLPWLIAKFLGYSDTLLAHQYVINGTNYTMAVTFGIKLLIQAAKQWAGGPKA